MATNGNLKFGWSLILSLILGILLVFLLTFAFRNGILLVFSNVTLNALIQAEATIIGFFGIIFIYALTSYDNRRDKIEATKLDYTALNVKLLSEKKLTEEKAKEIQNATSKGAYDLLENIRKNKKALIDYSLISGFCLLLSLLSLILALSAPNVSWTTLLSSVAVGLLFIGIFQIFWTIHDLGRDPCEQTVSKKTPPYT
jgi:hypothetical protein